MKTLTRDEAIEMATDLDIDFKKTHKTTYIIKLINDLTGNDYKEKGEHEEKNDKKQAKNKDDATKVGEEDTVRCIIHSNDRDNEETEVVGSVNGKTYQAQIGEEIDFPKEFIPSIKDAVIEVKMAILDDSGQPTGKYKERKQPRFVIERVQL